MSAMSELAAAVAEARPLMRDLESHVETALEEAQDELAAALKGLARISETPLSDVQSHLRDIQRLVGDAHGRLTIILAGELDA